MRTQMLFLAGMLSFLSLQAEDLAGYQKLRGTVMATASAYDYYFHKYNAFDTNEETSFIANEAGGWVGLDLGADYPVSKVRIYPMPDRDQQFIGSIFQGSDNPEFNNPVTLFAVTQAPNAGEYVTYDISTRQAFRYIRCINPDHRCSVAELEFYTNENSQNVNYKQLTNLPTIYLESQGSFDFVDKSIYVPAKVAVVNGDSTGIFDAELRGRGNSSWEFMEKKPFRIKFSKKQHFLGLPADAKSWTLIALAVDKTLLRNGLAFEISKSLGFEFTPSCVLVDVVLDGFYYGTFMASDHIEINPDRINIDEMAKKDITEPDITGGYHLEIDAYADQEPVHFRSPYGMPFTIKSPENNLAVQYQWIADHIAKTEQQLFWNREEALEKYIDLESAVKYYMHSELTGNCDSYWCVPCYKKRGDDKLYFGPVWDYDQAFLTNERVPRYATTLSTNHGMGQYWFRQIMQSPAAQEKLHALWKEVKSDNLKQHLLDFLDENSAYLQQSQTLNFERWHSLNRKVWFEDALFDTYPEYIDFVKQFIEDRFAWFDAIACEKQIILPTSEPGNAPKEWRYTFDEPEEGWHAKSFPDRQWKTGYAPFGMEQNRQNTEWITDKIFIRTHFNIDQNVLDSIQKVFFTVWHDEDCQIYLNGNLALANTGYLTSYQNFEFDKALLQAGSNTLAVKCIQTIGGQLIDVGISALMMEESKDTKLMIRKPDKYNWVVRDGMLVINQLKNGESVKLYSIDGRLVKQQAATSTEIQIALPNRGIYLLNISGQTMKIKY